MIDVMAVIGRGEPGPTGADDAATAPDALIDHAVFEIDRMYLSVYVPQLQHATGAAHLPADGDAGGVHDHAPRHGPIRNGDARLQVSRAPWRPLHSLVNALAPAVLCRSSACPYDAEEAPSSPALLRRTKRLSWWPLRRG